MENENKKVLIVPVDLFTANQPIYYIDGNKEPEVVNYSLIDDLPNTVDYYCSTMQIDKIHFFGSEEFLMPTITKIKSSYKNSIEIEVN